MRKVFFLTILIATVFANTLCSQNVKVKRGEVLLDGKAVAKLEKEGHAAFKYSTLDGTYVFTAGLEGVSQDVNNYKQWVEIQYNGQKGEVPYDVLVASLNFGRILSHLLTVKYKIFTTDGINVDAIEKVIAENGSSLSDALTKEIEDDIAHASQLDEKKEQVRNTLNPQVNADGTITFRNTFGDRIIVGRVVEGPNSNLNNPYIEVYDTNRKKVATLVSVGGIRNYEVTTYNDTYIYNPNSSYSRGSRKFRHDFIMDMVAQGYTFGNQMQNEQAMVQEQKIKMAMDTSINIYDQRGFVVDEDGIKYTGLLNIDFQLLDTEGTGNVSINDGIDPLGKRVQITYENEKGRTRTKTIAAKTGAYFCMDSQDEPSCFYGMAVKGDALKKLQNISSLGFNNSYFYKSIYKGKHIHLLKDPVETDRYVLKTNTQEKGQMIDRRKPETLSVIVAEYLEDCKELSEEIKAGAMDVTLLENLMRICKEYDACLK